jgi:hypothetical protein
MVMDQGFFGIMIGFAEWPPHWLRGVHAKSSSLFDFDRGAWAALGSIISFDPAASVSSLNKRSIRWRKSFCLVGDRVRVAGADV